MLRSIVAVILFLSLMVASLSAKDKPLTGRVEKWKLPSECTTLDPCYYTSPPMTILRPDSSNLAEGIECAEIWFKCRLNKEGKVTDAELIYSSTRDKHLRSRAHDALMATPCDPACPGKSACRPSLLHVVLVRKELVGVFELTYGKPEERNINQLKQNPEMVNELRPEYSHPARDAGITGTVLLSALLDTSGNVHEALVAKTSGNPLLDNGALLAAYYSKFKPAIKDERLIPCLIKYKVDFKIGY